MRFLDTREQKSPRFLVKEFPDIEIKPLTVGDYFSGENKTVVQVGVEEYKVLMGNLVEIKIGKDFGIHTEQLERFQDELYRMSCYRQKNPHVQLHAVWCAGNEMLDLHALRIFMNLCFQYHVWGHVFYDNYEEQLIQFLKELDQPSQYKEFEPYLKRSHEEPTDLSRALRIPKGVSSDIAIQLSECKNRNEINQIKGLTLKNGHESKLAIKIEDFLFDLEEFYNDIWFKLGRGESP